MYLTKGEFLQKFGILPQEFEEADISWEELLEIADDYERRTPNIWWKSWCASAWKIMQNTGKWMRQTICVM